MNTNNQTGRNISLIVGAYFILKSVINLILGGGVSDIFPVAAEVYSGEDYLAVSGGRRLLSLAGYFLRAAGAHAPSRSGDYAVGAESVAAVLYLDESAGAVEVGG